MLRKKRWWFIQFKSFLIFTIATVFYGGCAATKPPNLSDLTPELIQSRVSRNFHALRSFEGTADVIIEVPSEGYKGSSHVYINFPDSIFVKTEAILGIDIGSLFLNHKLFGAYAPRDNILYYGEIELLDLRDFLQVEIETDELHEILTGLTQVVLGEGTTLDYDDNKLHISSTWGNGQVEYWIDPQKYIVTQSRHLDSEGQEILTKEYKRLRKKEGIYLPQLIKVTRPQARERITVNYTRQKINKSVDPDKFRLKPAKNAKRVYWGDVSRRQLERPIQKSN